MSLLIKDNASLMHWLPNVVSEVKGEKPLFEKLDKYLVLSETWLITTFLGNSFFFELARTPAESEYHLGIELIVACDAFIRAIPSLDLVLTPNGFGVVSNQNVAPASKDRVAALTASMERTRDDALDIMLQYIRGRDAWATTEQARWFAKTIFPDLSSLASVLGEHRWADYLRLRPQILAIQDRVAADYISPQLLQQLIYDDYGQSHGYGGDSSGEDYVAIFKHVRDLVRTQILAALKDDGKINRRAFEDIVDIIRRRPSTFPEWHRSEVASLFSPPIFTNKKQSRGYFF